MQRVIFVPGLCCDKTIWEPQLHILSELFNTEVLDFSQLDSIQNMVTKTVENLNKPAVLIGISMGGRIAMNAACIAPERITKLIVINTWARQNKVAISSGPDFIREIETGNYNHFLSVNTDSYVSSSNNNRDQLITTLIKMQSDLGHRVFLRHIKAIMEIAEKTLDISQIKCPALVI